MTAGAFDAVSMVLGDSSRNRCVLAILPGYWLSARLNILCNPTDLSRRDCRCSAQAGAGTLYPGRRSQHRLHRAQRLWSPSPPAFSAPATSPMRWRRGGLPRAHLRFYHAMYQALLFAMNLALVANNIGLMWVAIEMATLTTVLMVGIYRTQRPSGGVEIFILGSVGIALALFGTILVYMAARPVVGEGPDGMVWTVLIEHVQASSTRRCSTSPSSFYCLDTAPRSASRRCTPGCRTRMRRGRRRSRPFSQGSCSTSPCMQCCV